MVAPLMRSQIIDRCRGILVAMTILLLADDRFVEHRPPSGHPERPERLAAAIDGINAAGFADALTWRQPSEAPTEALLGVHANELVTVLDEHAGLDRVRIDGDTYMSAGSMQAARLAAGAGLDAVAALKAGEADSAFCLVRPPGHHATPRNSMGFCLFNNIAVTAQSLTDQGERVAIIDFDAHHGNGTQDAFFDREDVLFISLHEYPQYPGSGALGEVGRAEGAGRTINFPMPSGATGDVYLRAFDQVIEPALDAFGADWVLISAGFDAHRDDPLTNLGLTSGDYAAMTARIASYAPPGRRIAFLEGGYDLDALGRSAAACVGALLGEDHSPEALHHPADEAQTNGGPGGNVVDAHLNQNPSL